jgi:hypothetical protein
MGYDKMITASMNVMKANFLELHPGGWYDMSEDNYVELAVVKFHMLAQFCEMMAESYSCTSENQIILGDEAEALATKLYEEYKPFIEAGCDIFSHTAFYDRKTLDKYKKRPIVNGHMNMCEEETLAGLPNGWSYEWPGQAQKMFNFGLICIDYDVCIRICIYDKLTDEQPIETVFITQHGNYQQVFRKYVGNALEILEACEFVYNEYHI